MVERIIAGIVIGFIVGIVEAMGGRSNNEKSGMGSVVIGIVAVAFIASSFVFGPVFGAMAVGEIAIGYWCSKAVFSKRKA